MKIFGENFRRPHITPRTTALAGHGRVKSQGNKPILMPFPVRKDRKTVLLRHQKDLKRQGFIRFINIEIFLGRYKSPTT